MDITTTEKNRAVELDLQIKGYANMAWQNLLEASKCLKLMRDTKLYTELGYESFEDYTVNSLGIKERQAYTYISTLERVGEQFLQSNATLGITKLSLLSSVPPTDRQEVVENNDIATMSVDEVKKLVAENDAKGEQIGLLNEDIAKKEEEISELTEGEAESQRRIAELEAELRTERERPVPVAVAEPSPEQIKKIEEAAHKKAEKEYKDTLKKEKQAFADKLQAEKNKLLEGYDKRIFEYTESLNKIDAEKAAALHRAEQLEKKLAVAASPETVKFGYYFEDLQNCMNKIIDSISALSQKETDTAQKFEGAVKKYLEIANRKISEAAK